MVPVPAGGFAAAGACFGAGVACFGAGAACFGAGAVPCCAYVVTTKKATKSPEPIKADARLRSIQVLPFIDSPKMLNSRTLISTRSIPQERRNHKKHPNAHN